MRIRNLPTFCTVFKRTCLVQPSPLHRDGGLRRAARGVRLERAGWRGGKRHEPAGLLGRLHLQLHARDARLRRQRPRVAYAQLRLELTRVSLECNCCRTGCARAGRTHKVRVYQLQSLTLKNVLTKIYEGIHSPGSVPLRLLVLYSEH